MSDLYFKALDGVHATHGGHYRYPGEGRWTKHLPSSSVEACSVGYHLARNEQIVDWLAPTLWLAEPCPDHELVEASGKVVTCRVRLVERLDSWNERTARLFAADCAEDVAHLTGNDERVLNAIAVARRFADGDATVEELDAARAAAWGAARAVVWDVGRRSAWVAARTAARDAARGAASATARAAASDAAWNAARDAGRSAAWDAARDTGRGAGWDTAWDAARSAARKRQYRRLLQYLGLDEGGDDG